MKVDIVRVDISGYRLRNGGVQRPREDKILFFRVETGRLLEAREGRDFGAIYKLTVTFDNEDKPMQDEKGRQGGAGKMVAI